MDTKKFIILLSCLTAVVCIITVVYNFSSMPPYGADTVSAVPLFASASQPSTTQSSTNVTQTSSTAASLPSAATNDDGADQNTVDSTSSVISTSQSGASKTSSKSASSSKASAQDPVNINTATLTQLETIPYIGTVKAQAILDYRAAHGKFTSINGLDNVKGIGSKTITKIAPYITIG